MTELCEMFENTSLVMIKEKQEYGEASHTPLHIKNLVGDNIVKLFISL